ncbi:hypothetical protein AC1031_008055 [Aphanomyces cochlioides]|nr:hypothetical protein AC1031_008055 [Aphanomyces cochlioides]
MPKRGCHMRLVFILGATRRLLLQCSDLRLVSSRYFILLAYILNHLNLVQLRRLQYKLVALDYALLTLPPTVASSSASVINFQANSRQSLSIRKQTCEVELKECMEKVRRLRLPTFELPPVENHFHPLTMPTFKRLHDPISVYLFKCEPNVPYWTQLVIHGRQIVNAHICRIAPLCLLDCQKWKEIIVRHNTKAGPSTWENTVIANHKLHCRLCTFPQCVYCTSSMLLPGAALTNLDMNFL